MIVYYFGADSQWSDEIKNTIRRRNMAVLESISQQESVSKVFNVIRTTRKSVIQKSKASRHQNDKIHNIYIAPIFPERGLLQNLFRPLNRFLLKNLYAYVFSNKNQNNSLAWCYWPKGVDDYEFLRLTSPMVFDTDHNIIDEPNSLEDQKNGKQQTLEKAGKLATYIISSSRSMIEWYNKRGFANTLLILNGVFEKRINLKPQVLNHKTYSVCYCGTLSQWMRLDWVEKVIQDHPDWEFNFIGENYKTDISEILKKYPNVILHGFLEPKDVDVMIKQSHVCFGLYQEDEALDVNSMKIYDYLAQGKPVVVNNYHPNLNKDFGGLLNIATSYEEFKQLLASPPRMDNHRLVDFLKKSSWNQRVKLILQEIKL